MICRRSAARSWTLGIRAKFENSSTRDLIVPASWMMVRAPSAMTVLVPGLGPLEVLDDPLGGELDGRQGVLDLVGDPLGDFLPGRDLLGLDELGQVVEDDDQAGEFAVRPASAGTGPGRGGSPARRRRSAISLSASLCRFLMPQSMFFRTSA